MPKSNTHVPSRKKRKRLLGQAKGYFGNKSRLYRYAIDAVIRAGQFAYRDRRKRKSDFRSLWVVRLNAACRERGLAYSRFIAGLREAGVEIDRKQLSEMAIHDPQAFGALVEKARTALLSPQ